MTASWRRLATAITMPVTHAGRLPQRHRLQSPRQARCASRAPGSANLFGRLPDRAAQHLLEPIRLDGPQRRDCVAKVVRLELRNVVANYSFERLHGLAGIEANSGHR